MPKRCVGDDRFDRDLPVLILKTSSQPLHHGTLGVIRSFGRVGVPVYCSSEPRATPAARSRYLAHDRIGILPTAEPAAAVAELKSFQRRIGRPVAVLPVDDNGALFLAESAEILGEAFRLPRQPPDLPRRVASKANLPQICERSGTPTPQTVVVAAGDDFPAATAAIRYPAVLKIAQPWLLPAEMRPALQAPTPDAALQYRSRLAAQTNAAMIVQELIPDDAAEDWFYHAYYAAGGVEVVGFTGRKLRSYPPFFGATSYGVSTLNGEVSSAARNILQDINYAGIVELEFRLDKRDRKYKLIDFNPRLGAQFQFLRNSAGVDVVRALHLDLSGRTVPVAPQVEGCTFVSDFTDLAAFGTYWRRGLVSAHQWFEQMVTAQEHAWYAADDLAPFAAASLYSIRNLLRRRSPSRQRPNARASRATILDWRPAASGPGGMKGSEPG